MSLVSSRIQRSSVSRCRHFRKACATKGLWLGLVEGKPIPISRPLLRMAARGSASSGGHPSQPRAKGRRATSQVDLGPLGEGWSWASCCQWCRWCHGLAVEPWTLRTPCDLSSRSETLPHACAHTLRLRGLPPRGLGGRTGAAAHLPFNNNRHSAPHSNLATFSRLPPPPPPSRPSQRTMQPNNPSGCSLSACKSPTPLPSAPSAARLFNLNTPNSTSPRSPIPLPPPPPPLPPLRPEKGNGQLHRQDSRACV